MDDTDRRILAVLEENARVVFSDLSRKIGMSGSAVAERVRRMEEEGIIEGYRAIVDPAKLGFPIRAYLSIHAAPENYAKIILLARELPEVREAHRVSGTDSFLLRIMARTEEDLARVVEGFSALGRTEAAQVISSPVQKFTT